MSNVRIPLKRLHQHPPLVSGLSKEISQVVVMCAFKNLLRSVYYGVCYCQLVTKKPPQL